MNLKIVNVFVIIYLFSFWNINAQIDSILKIGGLHQKSNQYYTAPEKIKLDDAQISVAYQFKHPLSMDKETSFTEDTMVLVAGPQFSIYYDRNDKIRRKAFSTYITHNGPPKVFFSTPFSKFTEIAINDNYLFTPPVSGETSQLYKNRKKDVITIIDFDNSNFDADELFFYYEEEISPINWDIKKDTMSVLGYACTQASCDFGGRSYTAWFTQDIPINDGPYKFYGLPGMILKIEDSEKLFLFEAIGLENLENTEIVIDDKSNYLKCMKDEYHILKKRMQENFTVFYRTGELLYHSYRKNGTEYIPIEIE
ncbi:hypothetical protein DSECCO2_548250 [anaerobic digester metagenome]